VTWSAESVEEVDVTAKALILVNKSAIEESELFIVVSIALELAMLSLAFVHEAILAFVELMTDISLDHQQTN